jgi:hypothetical protein
MTDDDEKYQKEKEQQDRAKERKLKKKLRDYASWKEHG